MFLKAGALSLVLLLASRLLGLARESAQAAAFGASGLADAAVLILTLPDWITGVLASGALAYVMLPAWAAMSPAQVAASQRQLARVLIGSGLAAGALTGLAANSVLQLLVPGLTPSARPFAVLGLLWTAAALPLALLAALWVTRLQHEREYVGMYGANLIVNTCLIGALASAGSLASRGEHAVVNVLGAGLLAAMLARLAWLVFRLRRHRTAVPLPGAQAPWPAPSIWLWAMLAAGLPLALPFAARSMASGAGEGALSVFNYAWKMVELPLMLAIQLVATLSFAPISTALARPGVGAEESRAAIRPAFALAWALACSAVAGLIWSAPAVSSMLFGWGRMDAASVLLVAEWGRTGAWSLLPQSLTAVALVAHAARRSMVGPVCAHVLGLGLLLAAGALGINEGRSLMLLLDVVLTGISLFVLLSLGSGATAWLPWSALLAGGASLLCCQAVSAWSGISPWNPWKQLALGATAALAVFAASWLGSADLRRALAR